jgi:MoaA/NifB/PqqE/SkfB family radical SAM enzyme
VSRFVVELTNRCNLRCQHCFEERHAATGDLPFQIIEKLLQEGKQCGIHHLSFTGGEPTLHRHFAEIISKLCAAGYTFSFVSNGSTFPQIYPLLVASRKWFTGVTFSLDGAREQTHDHLRGAGSYRDVMRAASICIARDLGFTLNMVLTAKNRHEIGEMVQLGTQLGARGVRFGHLMFTPETALAGLDLSPSERHQSEDQIWRLQKSSSLPIGMAPGHYSATPFFPCGPLELQEFNLDYQGNVTLCCQLSGYSRAGPETDVIGNLRQMTLAEACQGFRQRVASYLAEKHARVSRGEFGALDHFPCWYCVQYLNKVQRLEQLSTHPWVQQRVVSQEG